MFNISLRAGLAAAIFSIVAAGAAVAEPWQVLQTTGPVWVGADTAQLVSLDPKGDVAGGMTVVTGEGGRAMLVRGEQTMMVGPNAVITVPDEDTAGVTTVLQRAGEVTFDVDRQKVQHFAVETPYLAAVVKGTNFTVRLDGEDAAVSVNRGMVEVADLATGERVDTSAGQRASVTGTGRSLQIGGSGFLPVIAAGSPRSPMVAPLSIGELRVLQNKASGTEQASNQSGGTGKIDLAALGAGAGNGGGPSGGTGVDVSNGSGGTAAGAGGTQTVAFDNLSNTGFKRRTHAEEGIISPFTFALAAGLMTLLAVGLAYVRRNT
ncbi:MAG TPA: FecR family protein [Bauldia sp.]|nr:FecR family protein [Bauldia sp.]